MLRRPAVCVALRVAPPMQYAPSAASRIELVLYNRCRSNLFWVAERDAVTLSSGAHLP